MRQERGYSDLIKEGAVMFLHIVMMMFTKDVDDLFFEMVDRKTTRIRQECDGLQFYYFGENIADRSCGYTHATCAAFVDVEAHDAYQVSPAHMDMKAHMAPRIRGMVVYDGVVPSFVGIGKAIVPFGKT